MTCPSAKAPAYPIILSVNEALLLAYRPPHPIFLALLGGDKPTPSQRLCPELKGLVNKNRYTGAMRTFADTCSSCACAYGGKGRKGSSAPSHL